jgi:RimJ/RimL family protein N-acetyltransferase
MDLIYKWANDIEVRRNSFNSAPIAYENHVKWFNKIMADKDVWQFIMCDNGEPVGQIRLNIEADKAIIGYSVAPDKRRRGYAVAMLRLLIENVNNTDIKTLIGRVKYENHASSRAFEKCGFDKVEEPEYIEYRYTLPIRTPISRIPTIIR